MVFMSQALKLIKYIVHEKETTEKVLEGHRDLQEGMSVYSHQPGMPVLQDRGPSRSQILGLGQFPAFTDSVHSFSKEKKSSWETTGGTGCWVFTLPSLCLDVGRAADAPGVETSCAEPTWGP